MIEIRELCKHFVTTRSWSGKRGRETVAVDHVSLDVGEGQVLGLVGPNGAGKTTLIRMLCTMTSPSSGSARVGGFDTVQSDMSVRRLIGLVSSNERSFYWRLTGRENLQFFANLYRLPAAEQRSWSSELIDLLDLGHVIDSRFDHYSAGEKQRLAIARGLLSKPRVLLMDEPTKGVDPVGAAHMVQIVRERIMPQWAPTILITSHNLTEVERLCSRVAMMNHGRLVALGDLDELRAMADSRTHFSMAVRGLDGDRLKNIACDSEALEPVDVTIEGPVAYLDVSYEDNSIGFPRLVRGIVEQGGDLLRCDTREATFEEVFHSLIEKNDAAMAAHNTAERS